MPISIAEFLERIATSASDLYLLVCGDIVVYDGISQIVYIPEATHRSARLNPLGDFRTPLGHHLLWCRHIEIECTSDALNIALHGAGYQITPHQVTNEYSIYALSKQPELYPKY